jgi:hypothetical protein
MLHLKNLEEYLNTLKDIRDNRELLKQNEGWLWEYRYKLTNDRIKSDDELFQLINSAVDELERQLGTLSDDFILVLNDGMPGKYDITGQRIEVHRSNCERLELRKDDKVEHFTNFSGAFDKGLGLTNVIMADIHTCRECCASRDKGQLIKDVDEWRSAQDQ